MAKPSAGIEIGAVAELRNQIVVAPAAGDCAQFSRRSNDLENNSCVIGKPADDPDIDLYEFGLVRDAHRTLSDELFAA